MLLKNILTFTIFADKENQVELKKRVSTAGSCLSVYTQTGDYMQSRVGGSFTPSGTLRNK